MLREYHKDIKVKEVSGQKMIFSPVQKKWLVLTPEEMVRQMMTSFITDQWKISTNRMKMESVVQIGSYKKRYDILVYDKESKPLVLVECKSFRTELNLANQAQLLQYNENLRVPYLSLTNGREMLFASAPSYHFETVTKNFRWPEKLYS